GRSAIAGFELYAIPIPWVMAGGDHHSTNSAKVFYRIGEGRGGRVIVRDLYGDSSGSQDLCGGLGEAARTKPRIVPNDNSASRACILQTASGNSASNTAHVFKGVVIGDNTPPAVSSKFDLIHFCRYAPTRF